jgi:hypothetical protein
VSVFVCVCVCPYVYVYISVCLYVCEGKDVYRYTYLFERLRVCGVCVTLHY